MLNTNTQSDPSTSSSTNTPASVATNGNATADHTPLSLPRLLLHAEGAAIFAASLWLYAQMQGNGWLLLLLILSPDISMVGYLIDKTWGARFYNIAHTYTLPLAVGGLALLLNWQPGVLLAIIWMAHIGMDRMVGYGLKYSTAFKDTHLGRV